MMETPEREAIDENERVASVLAQLKAGLRQSQGELASLGADPGVDDGRLARLWALGQLAEPPCESPRPVIGRALVALRRAFFGLFVRWYAAPLLERQNELNAEHLRVLRGLLVELADLRRQMAEPGRRAEQVERRLAVLERRLERVEPGERTRQAGDGERG